MHSFISLLMLTNPIAFKTRHRKDAEGNLMGVDPPVNMAAAIHNVTVWLLSEGESEADKAKVVASIDNSRVVEVLSSRLQFFHQQMFLAFLITYVIILFLGQTIYGILYLIFFMIVKTISVLLNCIRRKARETKLRIQNKVLRRQNMIVDEPELVPGL